MFLTYREQCDYRLNLWAATVLGLLLSLSNTLSATSSLLASQFIVGLFLHSILVQYMDCSLSLASLSLSLSIILGNNRNKQNQATVHLISGIRECPLWNSCAGDRAFCMQISTAVFGTGGPECTLASVAFNRKSKTWNLELLFTCSVIVCSFQQYACNSDWCEALNLTP